MNVRNNKGMAFIAAFSIYAILMVLTVTFLWMTDSDLNIATNQRDTTKALYIGEAGIEYGIYKLLADWNWPGATDVSLGGGTFTVAVTEPDPPDGRKILTSTGNCQQPLAMGRVAESKRKIQVTINPTAFRYTVMSTANVELDARAKDSSGVVLDPSFGDCKAYVHSNTKVRTRGNVILGDAEITEVSPTVFIPDVDMDAYKTEAIATGDYAIGNLTITTANQDSYQDKIVYRTGNITINADTDVIDLDGTTLVAEGNIVINGDYAITINPDDEPLADTAYPSLITEDGDITGYFDGSVNNNLELLIYTKNGKIELDNLRMNEGSVIAGAVGLTLAATKNKMFSIAYDDTILTTNKPKYFTTSVDTAGLLWEEVN